MSNLIEKRSLQERLIIAKTLLDGVIKDLPSAHKTGRWIKISADKYTKHAQYFYRCDKCGADTIGKQKYCPNCGSYNGGET